MTVTEEQKQHVRQLLEDNKKILAVKYLRESFGMSLKDSKKMADLIEQDIERDDPAKRTRPIAKKVKGKPIKVVSSSFMGFGLIMIGIAAYLLNDQIQFTQRAIYTTAEVVATPYNPLFEYEVNGQKYQYQSSVTSDPPSYSYGEKVNIYVDPNAPYDVLIDTITDRWLGMIIVGAMGIVFLFVGYVTSRVF